MKTFLAQSKKNSGLARKGGFVALFAVLISAVVLAITLGISNVAYKEVFLTSQARDANYAFFAADTGSECALYADLNKISFGGLASDADFDCNGGKVAVSGVGTIFTFELNIINGTNNSCAKVTVDKDSQSTVIDPDLGPVTISSTQIDSLGYNVSCAEVDAYNLSSNPSLRVVQRAERVTYPNDVATTPTP
jgi:hypothetical protein